MKKRTFTVNDFFKTFPDDSSCLNHLMAVRYGAELDCPKCGKHGKFSRIKKLPAYQCAWCGHHIHPMAGTPFERTSTALQKWFYAMYLFTTSRHGVPAKELQRQLGVTYKTAWRMGHEIRKYMAEVDGDAGLSGHVEIDETYVGGRDNEMGHPDADSKKAIVLGMVQRGGDVMTHVIEGARWSIVSPFVERSIAKSSCVSTDQAHMYRNLRKHGYRHGSVNHSIHQWVKGDIHTNTIENFWGRLKNSIRGTHVHVSKKHLAKYLGEFEYRYNMRATPSLMFDRLLKAF